MLLVHLTDQSNVARIKRAGLHVGPGQQGRGVYAVPLFRIPVLSWADRNAIGDLRTIPSVPVASSYLWMDLFKGRQPLRGRRPLAVVFEPSAASWPIDLFVINANDVHRGLVGGEQSPGFAVARRAHSLYLRVEVRDGAGLGEVVHRILGTGTRLNHWDLEVVVRRPVPASAIRRIVGFSRPTRKRTFLRERGRTLGETDPDA